MFKLSCAYKRKQIVSPDFNHRVKVTNYYFTYVEIKIICRLPLRFIPSNLRSGPGFFFPFFYLLSYKIVKVKVSNGFTWNILGLYFICCNLHDFQFISAANTVRFATY